MDEPQVKKLLSSLKCGVCGQRYRIQNLQVLGHRDELWFLNVSCTACGSQGMMAAVVKESRAYPVITDLSPEELERFGTTPAITGDDILDMHHFLKDFDGDFSRLFALP